jgi:ectoine hydroxylase-related dioxygenase (phytanoyl-CoA dioxygenase family)
MFSNYLEAMFALTNFNASNGATRIVPGSHKWPPNRKAVAKEITYAEISAGSALLYLGSAIHGGVANNTVGQTRRGMLLGYVVGWLRAEENTFFNRSHRKSTLYAGPLSGVFRVQSAQ